MRRPSLADLVVKEDYLIHDDRGFFISHTLSGFKQVNTSFSKRGVLRGLHAQIPEQGKMVRCISGSVMDVVVDPETGNWRNFLLNNRFHSLWVPPGYLHGFIALEDSLFQYYVTEDYNPNAQYSVKWNDGDIEIPWRDWYSGLLIISEKDRSGMSLAEYVRTVVRR